MPLTRKKKRPRDPNKLGKMIVDLSVRETGDQKPARKQTRPPSKTQKSKA